MKLVAVTRVLNEDDIVEAFVRHTARHVDHHILMDGGSVDRTVEILLALQQEGLSVTVMQSRSVSFVDANVQTAMFMHAAHVLAADWVLHLAPDEFIDDRFARNRLEPTLAAVKPGIVAVALDVIDYVDSELDDAAELVVPRRIRYRTTARSSYSRLFVRTARVAEGMVISAGAHLVQVGGVDAPTVPLDDYSLAHYARRNGWQELTEILVGRLSVLATGPTWASSEINGQYTGTYDALRADPSEILKDGHFAQAASQHRSDLAEDPIRYTGGDLRYTVAGDARVKAAKCLLGYVHELATQHGKLLEQNTAIREQVLHWSTAAINP